MQFPPIIFFGSPHFACLHSAVRSLQSAVRSPCFYNSRTVYEYREKGRSCVKIFFQRLNEIWNPIKTSDRLVTCQITLVKFIWRSDQLNGIYRASSKGHRELLFYSL